MGQLKIWVSLLCLAEWYWCCVSHGVMTHPPSTRHNGSIAKGGDCFELECRWFSDFVTIPGEPILNEMPYRTMNIDVNGGPTDWSRKHPWRSPGTAPVFGSGCGSAGGGPVAGPFNGGLPPPNYPQGTDGLVLPSKEPHVWQRGGVEKVAWAIHSNHGGGYSWRLCSKKGNVTEDCFQRNVLEFVGNTSTLEYKDHWIALGSGIRKKIQMPRYQIPRVLAADQKGNLWARNPIPACSLCTAQEYTDCGGYNGGNDSAWPVICAGLCLADGSGVCPPYKTQFPEPLPGLSGHIRNYKNGLPTEDGFTFSIVDEVLVPNDLEEGDYLLSWRWDAEHSPQIWQNCADIKIVHKRLGNVI